MQLIKSNQKGEIVMNEQIQRALELYYNREFSKAEVARQLGVSPRTIGRWLDKYDESDLVSSADETDDEVEQEQEEVVETDYSISVLATRKSISLTKICNKTNQVIDSVVVNKDVPNFDEIFNLIASSRLDQQVLAQAYKLCTPKTMVEELTSGKIKVDLRKNSITYTPDDGQPYEVSNRLSVRIIETLRKNGTAGADSIMNFLNRLMNNPSYRAVNELYGFLEHNDIEVNADGKFYAWKVVRNTYMDKHSNTMLNAVGTDVRVNRNQVDENSEQTCSYGLHVCAKHYIKSFYSLGDRIVKVEVDPADVVAIPKDYNDSKMRCCGYYVAEDVTDTIKW